MLFVFYRRLRLFSPKIVNLQPRQCLLLIPPDSWPQAIFPSLFKAQIINQLSFTQGHNFPLVVQSVNRFYSNTGWYFFVWKLPHSLSSRWLPFPTGWSPRSDRKGFCTAVSGYKSMCCRLQQRGLPFYQTNRSPCGCVLLSSQTRPIRHMPASMFRPVCTWRCCCRYGFLCKQGNYLSMQFPENSPRHVYSCVSNPIFRRG